MNEPRRKSGVSFVLSWNCIRGIKPLSTNKQRNLQSCALIGRAGYLAVLIVGTKLANFAVLMPSRKAIQPLLDKSFPRFHYQYPLWSIAGKGSCGCRW